MDFIRKVYSICCYTNAQSEVYGTDIIPMVCHNGNIDLEKTVQNVEQVCKYFRMDPSKPKQITDLILWRIERMSRSFSGCLRHDPRHGIHKECRRQVDMGPDGSVELYDALTCITHARNFIKNMPGLLLMAMFPSYGKSRIEIAFVFPSVDGPYKERKARGEIVPRNRWTDKLTTRSAQNALRPDGKEFYVDPEMEFYVTPILHIGILDSLRNRSRDQVNDFTEETLNLSMPAKQPPSYDGKVSWFRYEELVDGWVTITTVEAPKRGPLLKSRLTGDAYMYKAVLQNDLLQDPDEGVNYFKNTLKKYFLKGATNVYLYRLLSFFNHGMQTQEFLIFTSKFEILLMRLKAAWMDLMPVFTAQSPIISTVRTGRKCKNNCSTSASSWYSSTASSPAR